MSEGERGLAAIMFTDIEGYSALTSRDEALALELLRIHWDLLRPVFAAHKGREVKTIGDAFLIEFPSALQAVRAGMGMQDALAAYNAKATNDRQIRVRIGIHVGDVERIEGDLFGDGVNVTSRIEPLSPSGGLAISDPVYQQVRNKVGIQFYSIGPQSLKNIAHPMEVYTTDRMQRARKALGRLPGATITGLPVMNTVIQVLRNPARTALALRDGASDLVRPWPLVITLIGFSVLLQQVMPLPGNSIADASFFEQLPPVAELFQNEAIDLTKLRSSLSRLESILYPLIILVIAVFTAAGLRVLDGTRRFFEFVDTFVYATAAAAICMVTVHPLFYFFARDRAAFSAYNFSAYNFFDSLLNVLYFLYAIWWLYWDRKALAIGQSTMFLVANLLGQMVAVILTISLMIVFVKVQYGEYIGAYGNSDIYIADIAIEKHVVSVLRPSNVTNSVALHENASFSADGKRLLASVATNDKGSNLFAWDLRTGAGKQLTTTPGVKESGAVELADGSLLVIRDFALWRYARGVERERMLPDGEDVRYLCVGPGRTAMLVSGEEHRGLLFDLDSHEIRLLPGATKLGRQVQWHPELHKFTAIRTIDKHAEIIAIDPETGEIHPLVRMPSSPRDGYHAWAAPDIAIWANESIISAVALDGSTWPVVDLEKQGIRNISHLIVDPARSRIAFERTREMTLEHFRERVRGRLEGLRRAREQAPQKQ